MIDVNQDKLGKMGRRVTQVTFTMKLKALYCISLNSFKKYSNKSRTKHDITQQRTI